MLAFIATCLNLSCLAHAETIVSGGVGYTHSSLNPSSQFRISDYVFDTLNNTTQQYFPSLNLSVKKSLSLNIPYVSAITLGPAFYYQKITYSGQVWELGLPEFSNYTYQFGSENFPLLLEGDVFFQPCWRIQPFISAGLGVAMLDVDYVDHATSHIDPASELHLNQQQFNFVYDVGLGLAYVIDKHWSVNLKYNYMYLGHANSGTATNIRIQQPIRIKLETQNIFFTASYGM